jgi:hypothetical protein
MSSRFTYTLPTIRHWLANAVRRVLPGGLAGRLAYPAGGDFIIVAGPGRSGTSAVARVLHESGVSMGDDLRPASDFNPVGFYEEQPVILLNDAILKELGMERFDRWQSRAGVLAVAERHADDMRELATTTLAQGWKDPRFSTTLEAWLPHLPRRPKIVVCLRSPEAYLHSVVRIYGLVERAVVKRSWEYQLTRILDVIRDYHLEATCVEYDALVQQPAETVAALSAFVGRPLDPKYVKAELRQFVQPVAPDYAALYECVRRLGGVRPKVTHASSETPSAYAERVRAIEREIMSAKRAWDERTGMPEPPLLRTNGLDAALTAAMRETHAISRTYFDDLGRAQAQLDGLWPPAGFERYHELMRDFVDKERLVAYFMLSLTEGADLDHERLTNTIAGWRKLCSPEVTSVATKAREQALHKALRVSP